MATKKKKRWIIRKEILANTIEEALSKEQQAKIVECRLAVPEKDQLVSAIGFEAHMTDDEEDDY